MPNFTEIICLVETGFAYLENMLAGFRMEGVVGKIVCQIC